MSDSQGYSLNLLYGKIMYFCLKVGHCYSDEGLLKGTVVNHTWHFFKVGLKNFCRQSHPEIDILQMLFLPFKILYIIPLINPSAVTDTSVKKIWPVQSLQNTHRSAPGREPQSENPTPTQSSLNNHKTKTSRD